MQVAEGVFQFKVPMPTRRDIPDGGLRYTLVYAVQISGGWVVIDAGLNTDEGFKAFQGYLSEAGIVPQDVSLIVITHGHPDHMGLANRFKELTGARLAMHRLDASGGDHHRARAEGAEAEAVREWIQRYGIPEGELRGEFIRRPPGDFHGDASPWHFSPPSVDLLLEGGEELVAGSGLWAVWTPGHSAGHLCIHDRKRRLLFAGDHVLPTITPHVSLYPGDDGNPLGHFLEAQRYLKELDVDMVHPAHEHSFPDLGRRVDEILDHHRERMNEMLAQVRNGPRTAWQITSGIKWNVAPWEQLGSGTRRMALMETMSHLQHMVEEGELSRQETDSVVQYARP